MATDVPPQTPGSRANTQTSPRFELMQGAGDPLWDIFWKEWSECRTTIGRLDSILVDLRKVGFSLVTALLTASAFFGLTGAKAPPVTVQIPALLAIMLLIATLAAVDNYYEVLLTGAVERALELELQTSPPIRLTKQISDNAHKTGATLVTWLLYAFLFVGAVGLALFAAISANSSSGFYWVVGVSAALAIFIVANWLYSNYQVGLLRSKTPRQWPEDVVQG